MQLQVAAAGRIHTFVYAVMPLIDHHLSSGPCVCNALDAFKVGDSVQLKVQRSGDQGNQTLTLTAVLVAEK